MKMEDRKLGGSGSAISARAERSGETRALHHLFPRLQLMVEALSNKNSL